MEECPKCDSNAVIEGMTVVEGGISVNRHYRWCTDCGHRWYQEPEITDTEALNG